MRSTGKPNEQRAKPRGAAAASRSVRSDGAQTHQHILQVAGSLYAERGFEGTTSRAICTAAGVNMAAVNYHFGGKDELYEAVLVEAHAQLLQLSDLEAIVQSSASPENQLRGLIALFLQPSRARQLPWFLRVLVKELLTAPSSHLDALLQQAVLPKVRLALSIVAGVIGIPAQAAAAQRALALVVMPCIMLNIAPRASLRAALPALSANPQALIDDMTRYALAGLAAIAREHGSAPAASGAPTKRPGTSSTSCTPSGGLPQGGARGIAG